jgi:hypothetical protein
LKMAVRFMRVEVSSSAEQAEDLVG